MGANIALLLVIAGLLAIYAEIIRPGYIVPGVCGSVSLIYGLVSLAPVNGVGMETLLLSVLLMTLGVKYPARRSLSIAAVVLMPVAFLIMKPAIDPVLTFLLLVPFGILTHFLLTVAVRARRNKLHPISCK